MANLSDTVSVICSSLTCPFMLEVTVYVYMPGTFTLPSTKLRRTFHCRPLGNPFTPMTASACIDFIFCMKRTSGCVKTLLAQRNPLSAAATSGMNSKRNVGMRFFIFACYGCKDGEKWLDGQVFTGRLRWQCFWHTPYFWPRRSLFLPCWHWHIEQPSACFRALRCCLQTNCRNQDCASACCQGSECSRLPSVR